VGESTQKAFYLARQLPLLTFQWKLVHQSTHQTLPFGNHLGKGKAQLRYFSVLELPGARPLLLIHMLPRGRVILCAGLERWLFLVYNAEWD
jgi:hypothetical protein